MSYIRFDKKQLVNLESSLQKEILRSNTAGSYLSTTIIGCNTRKYHGLLVSLQPQINNQHHVFLSSLDETVIQQESEFGLGIHKYKDEVYEPGGHKYIDLFESDPIPMLTYSVGGLTLNKERIFISNEDRIMIRYTMTTGQQPAILRFKPFLAFRSVHFLNKANSYADTSFAPVKNGIRVKLYEAYNPLFMQFSKEVSYKHNPQWYYGIEYIKEKSRGYEYLEDLYIPGNFEVKIEKGESIVFAAGFEEIEPGKLSSLFQKESDQRIPRDSFKNCLLNAAQQFFIHKKDNKIDLIAGYHWFAKSGRDTFIALPGLTLPQNDTDTFMKVIDTIITEMNGPFFPNSRIEGEFIYNSVDAPLLFFWALQQYVFFTEDREIIWRKYAKTMELILTSFRSGTLFNVHMLENGLLYAGNDSDSLTWMNVRFDNKPFINRNGLAVEVNALWYNAICFYSELAAVFKDKKAVMEWKPVISRIENSFSPTFWDEQKGYLADVVRGDYKDFRVRPNQVFAASLHYSPVYDFIRYQVLKVIKRELLTPRGLRTLSPNDPDYKGIYQGDLTARDTAYHQGSAFPWLFGAFTEGYLRIHGRGGLNFIKKLYNGFEDVMWEAGIGTVSELYYGDPPHLGKGAISQAWSVAELLRMEYLIKQYE
ncbi:MAG: amylo-alpha-1,6-glucosidase [Bacteroidetes bacterium]|nr:amylo-alpha-1,6-glucosidase [Bacteroidota bacterium]